MRPNKRSKPTLSGKAPRGAVGSDAPRGALSLGAAHFTLSDRFLPGAGGGIGSVVPIGRMEKPPFTVA